MRKSQTPTKIVCVTILFLCGSSLVHGQTGCYPNAPPILESNVQRVATDIVQNSDAARLDSLFNDILFYAIADAVTLEKVSLRNLKAYEYLGETGRTDKQTGTSAKSEGSTSAVEKPGFVQFLGLAIEHGAIQQQVSGTRLTLSTSPYAFIAWSKGDTAETYRNYEFFNRIGASASFNISDNQSSVLANVKRKDLTEWSVRLRLVGDRSTRSVKFQQLWTQDIKPKIQRRLNVITAGESAVFIQRTGLNELRKNLLKTLRDEVGVYLQAHASEADTTVKTNGIKEIVLCKMKSSVLDKIQSGEVTLESPIREEITDQFIPALFSAHQDLEQARQLLDKDLEKLNGSPLMTLTYTNHRTTGGPNYSELMLLFEQKAWSPMTLVANGGFSIYHNPDPTKRQENLRDIDAAISFQGKTSSPFLTEATDLSKVTYAFSGRYQRMRENAGVRGKKADIAVAQFKLEIPIGMGVSFPLSVTYANATELIKETEVRGNFGITLDTDKLFALTRRVLKP